MCGSLKEEGKEEGEGLKHFIHKILQNPHIGLQVIGQRDSSGRRPQRNVSTPYVHVVVEPVRYSITLLVFI